MEASASGLLVVATAVGEVPQIVSDGETGMLVKPKDVDGLVKGIETIIDNPLSGKKMGEAGRRRMEEKYSWEIICDKLEKAYQEVIDRSR
ncbi:MAG: glycosyltransferase [Dehalococcoidales bacterium]|nr:glycosyltransferase [Dehalococcoidales bacterium]